MKLIENPPHTPILELTRRNLVALLKKLDYNKTHEESVWSARTLIDPDHKIMVKAVEDEEHYAERGPGLMLDNEKKELY